MLHQISIFIENKTGSLAEATDFLARKGVNLKALCIADTEDFGILRIIVDDYSAVANHLRAAGFIIKVNHVVAVNLPDEPGSMAKVVRILADNKLVIEYTYAFLTPRPGMACVIFRVDDNAAAIKALDAAGIELPVESELFG